MKYGFTFNIHKTIRQGCGFIYFIFNYLHYCLWKVQRPERMTRRNPNSGNVQICVSPIHFQSDWAHIGSTLISLVSPRVSKKVDKPCSVSKDFAKWNVNFIVCTAHLIKSGWLSRRARCAGHVARIKEGRSVFKILTYTPRGKRS